MQLESKSLKKTFEFVTFEKEENGKVVTIITHDSLEDVIHNQCEDVNYDVVVVKAERDHSVVACTMYKDNRRITAYGETVPETLENEIARNHPTLIATQRAFDRAAIRFLALPGKCFSNMEINIDALLTSSVGSPKNETPVASTTETISAPQEEVVVVEDVEEIADIDDGNDVIEIVDSSETGGIVSSVVETEDDGLMVSDDIEEIFTDEDELIDDPFGGFEETAENKLEELAGYVVSIKGKHAGKTIGEIWDSDQTYITNFLLGSSFKPANDLYKKDLEKVREFAELKK